MAKYFKNEKFTYPVKQSFLREASDLKSQFLTSYFKHRPDSYRDRTSIPKYIPFYILT